MKFTKEELSLALVNSLRDIASLLESAHTIALKEQDALIKNDAEEITLICRAQEDMLRRINESDQRAAAIAVQIANMSGLSAEEIDSNRIYEIVGTPYSDMIRNESKRVRAIAKEVQDANEINSHLLENGLEIITCCLRTLATDSTAGGYGNDAVCSEPEPYVLSLDLRA